MSDPMIELLARPLIAMRASLGQPGDVSAPVAELSTASSHLEAAVATGRTATTTLDGAWHGGAGSRATERVAGVQTAAGQIADRTDRIGPIVVQAAADLDWGRAQLDGIIAGFRKWGDLHPQQLHTSDGVTSAVAAAQQAIQNGLGVVNRVSGSMDTATRALQALTPPAGQVPRPVGGISTSAYTNVAAPPDGPAPAALNPGSPNPDNLEALWRQPSANPDPVQTITNALAAAAATAVSDVVVGVGDGIGGVIDHAVSAVGTVIDHVGDGVGHILDHTVADGAQLVDHAMVGTPIAGQQNGPAAAPPPPGPIIGGGAPGNHDRGGHGQPNPVAGQQQQIGAPPLDEPDPILGGTGDQSPPPPSGRPDPAAGLSSRNEQQPGTGPVLGSQAGVAPPTSTTRRKGQLGVTQPVD